MAVRSSPTRQATDEAANPAGLTAQSPPQNIVVILADDLGFSDLGCYGGEIRTPNLDRLARSGIRMSNFYTTPRCSPSRAALLTGRHPHEVGIGVLTSNDLPNGYPGSLDPEVPTVAQCLQDAGYATYLAGKWHLSSDDRNVNDTWPTRRGFDDCYGLIIGAASYFQPTTLHRGEDSIDDETNDPDYYLTDAITDNAVNFLTSHADQPCFLYLSYTAPHWPLHAREADIDSNAHRFDTGWDDLRSARLERLKKQGILGLETDLSPRDEDEPAWEDINEPEWYARRMEVYAAQVESMDRGIGRVVETLERLGTLDDTLIIFLSDNGGSAEELRNTPTSATSRDRRICPAETRDGRPVRIGNFPDIAPGPEDTYASYGRPWANLSNTPFRQYKRWVHEGGIASPLIAFWPAGGLANGIVDDSISHVVDLMPTLLNAARASTPPQLRGIDLQASWRGVADATERDLHWEHMGNAAIRRGKWKLVREWGSDWELYDLEADRTELTDLALALPGKVDQLGKAWDAWATKTGVLPWDSQVERYPRPWEREKPTSPTAKDV